MENDIEILAPVEIKSFTIRISDNLYHRLNTQLRMLKHLNNNNFSKQKWIADAIKEKMLEEEKKPLENISHEKFITIKIDKDLDEKIEKRVNLMSKFMISYSKKKWFLEALYRKLDEEEQKTRALFEKMINSSSN